MWEAGIDQMLDARNAGKLDLPMTSHRYLYAILAALADKAEGQQEAEALAHRQAQARARLAQQQDWYEAQRAVAQALEVERRNFRCREFGSLGKLLKLLDEDVAALEMVGYLPLTKHRQGVLERWAQATKTQRRAIEREFVSWPSPLGHSPAEALLAGFDPPAWHERARRLAGAAAQRAQALAAVVVDRPVRDELKVYQAPPVDCEREAYSVIEAELRDWYDTGQSAVDTVRSWRNEQKKQAGDVKHTKALLKVVDERIDEWQESLSALRRFVENEPYGKCLLLTGRAGSGKSHFVARLLRQHEPARGQTALYTLYVPPSAGAADGAPPRSVEAILLEAARFHLSGGLPGPVWRSFAEVADFVAQSPEARLVVVIDDLDAWLRAGSISLEALQAFIAQHTPRHHLFWVLCIRENQYHLISNLPAERLFWSTYTISQGADTIGGWAVLDRLNVTPQRQVWREIVTASMGADSGYDLDSAVAHLNEQSRRLIELPFVAALFGWFLQENRPLAELPNLNYVTFVREYWQRRLDGLLNERRSPDEPPLNHTLYWRAIALTAALVMEEASLRLTKNTLAQRWQRADDDQSEGFAESAAGIVAALGRSGLLRELHDPAVVARHGHLVQPDGFMPLWYWQAAEYLVHLLHEGAALGRLSLAQVYRALKDHFTSSELQDLCFEMGVAYDDLPGVDRSSKARELVMRVERAGRLGELLELVRQEYPAVTWPILGQRSQVDEIEAWLRRYFERHGPASDQDPFQPDVLEFFILLLGQSGQKAGGPAAPLDVASTSIRLLPDYQSHLWLGAAKGSGEFQQALGEWLIDHEPGRLVADAGLPQFLYFLKYAAAGDSRRPGLSCVQKMMLLRPCYTRVQKGEYLRTLLEEIWRTSADPLDAARSMAYLHGLEEYLDQDSNWIDAAELARWTYGELERLSVRLAPAGGGAPDEWSHFGYVHRLMVAFVDELDHFQPQRGELDQDRRKHWVQLISIHSDHFAPFLSAETLEWLEESGWLSRQRAADIPYAVHERLTFRCGYWFRRAKPWQKARYTDAVEEWTSRESSSQRKRIAFYLIKHSVPSQRPKGKEQEGEESKPTRRPIPVSGKFWQLVKRLQGDPDNVIRKMFKEPVVSEWVEAQKVLPHNHVNRS